MNDLYSLDAEVQKFYNEEVKQLVKDENFLKLEEIKPKYDEFVRKMKNCIQYEGLYSLSETFGDRIEHVPETEIAKLSELEFSAFKRLVFY